MKVYKSMTWKKSVNKLERKIQTISVIVPVYNVAPYLERCVESLINQAYPCMEIILIDDGSTDNSGQIADVLANEYSNVIVIHQKNEGVSAARNAGLRRSTGDYIGFVDPDDFVDRDMYAYLYEQIQKHNADIAACTWVNEYEDNTPVSVLNGTNAIFSAEEAVTYDLFYGMFITCNKLFSRKTCYNVFYDEKVINGEDRIFDVQALLKAERVVYVNKPFYHYCHRTNSAGTKKFTPKDDSLIKACIRIKDMVANRSRKLKNLADLQLVKAYMQLINMMDGEVDKYKPNGRVYLKALRKNILSTIKNPVATNRLKLMLSVMCISPILYQVIMRMWKNVRRR